MDGGYDCEFVDVLPPQLQHDCAVCLMTLKEPYITSCCGYSFCRVCIQRVQSRTLPCPLCNETDFSIFPNKGLQRSLREFRVYCQFKKSGCEWSGKLGELEQHLNSQPTSETRMRGCLYVELGCVNGCGTTAQRKNLLEHEETCVLRPHTCEYCLNYESPYNEIVDHWGVCDSYPMLCPNRCTDVTFERKRLDQHLNEECPLLVERCDICESEVPRHRMPMHLQQHSATNTTKNVYLEYNHPSPPEDTLLECAAVGDYDSLDSQLKNEIALKHKLEQKIEEDKGRSEQIRKEIQELQQNCEHELSQLKADLQVKQQEVDEYYQVISSKESEITSMKEKRDRALAVDKAAFEKQIALLNEMYQEKMEQYRRKKADNETKKLAYELELERTKHKYEMEIKTLELELERKKTRLAQREHEGYLRDEQIHKLQAEIALDKERKEKKRLMEEKTHEIEELKKVNASLERRLQSFAPRPEQPELKPNEDYM